MNLKKILAITLLMTIFMVGTVSASDVDTNIAGNSESQNVLGNINAADFNFVIAKEASIKNKDAVVVSFDWPDTTIHTDSILIKRIGSTEGHPLTKMDKKSEKVTLDELGIFSPGNYSYIIYFGDDNVLRTFTIKVTENDNTDNSNSQQATKTQTSTNNAVQLTLKKITVKKSAKQVVLTGTLKKGKTALKNKWVTFKFNGKKYKVKTNNKGIAKVTIKKAVLKKLKVGKKITYQMSYGSIFKRNVVKVKK